MKRFLSIFVIFALLLLSIPAASADTANVRMSGICIGDLTAQFTAACDSNYASYYWDFGDGTTADLVQNPTHLYSKPGRYVVSVRAFYTEFINAYSGIAREGTATMCVEVTGSAAPTPVPTTIAPTLAPVAPVMTPYQDANKPIADFKTLYQTGGTVQFADQSSGNVRTWLWDFGDGIKSIEQSPLHTYSGVGTYTVSLTASNAAGTDVETKPNFITVGVGTSGGGIPPVANFEISRPNKYVSTAVRLAGTSTLDPTVIHTYHIDWGDGQVDKFVSSRTHIYKQAGVYTITYTVSDVFGSSTKSETYKVDGSNPYDTVLSPYRAPVVSNSILPIADFVVDQNTVYNGPSGATFTFTSTSKNMDGASDYNFIWDFGNDGRGYGRTCSHSFTGGLTDVKLTVMNSYGTDVAYGQVLPTYTV